MFSGEKLTEQEQEMINRLDRIWEDAYKKGMRDGYDECLEHQKSILTKVEGPPPKDGKEYVCWDEDGRSAICCHDGCVGGVDIWIWNEYSSYSKKANEKPIAHLAFSLDDIK